MRVRARQCGTRLLTRVRLPPRKSGGHARQVATVLRSLEGDFERTTLVTLLDITRKLTRCGPGLVGAWDGPTRSAHLALSRGARAHGVRAGRLEARVNSTLDALMEVLNSDDDMCGRAQQTAGAVARPT